MVFVDKDGTMASDTSDIPAGYFTTFSLSDLNGLTPETLVRTQRRNRRVFVCIPCHRKKLRCDKLLPCSRCLAAGIPDECSYQPPPSASSTTSKKTRKGSRHDTKSGSSPADSLGSPYSSSSHDPYSFRGTPGSKTTNGTSLASNEEDDWEVSQPLVKPLRGVSHWTRISCEFEEAVPYLFGTEPRWQQRYTQVKNLECLFAAVNDNANFPFGASFCSKEQVLRSFPPNHVIDVLVGNYLNTFGATHYLFHPSQLHYDFDTAVSDEWLAEFCMVLGLGAETAPEYLFAGLAQSATAWVSTFMSAAQASFGRSLYMTAPSLSTVRTLCMMVIAKLAEVPGSGGSSGGNWTYAPLVSLMALTVQTAKALQLHRSASVEEPPLPIDHHDSLEAEMRRRVWVVVRLLDLETALRSGTTMQSDTGDAEPPQGHAPAETMDTSCNDIFNFSLGSQNSLHSPPDYDGLYLNKVSSFLPLLADMVNTVNSPTKPGPSPRRVAACSSRIQKQLEEFGVCHDDARTVSQVHRSNIQAQYIEVITHRVLLALHHDSFCGAAATRVMQSPAIVSAHALFNIQKVWATGAAWLLDLCHETFGVGILHHVVALRAMYLRVDENDDENDGTDVTDMTEMVVAAEKAVSGCHQLLRGRSCRSVAQFNSYYGTSVLAACLRGLHSEDMLSEIVDATNEVEQVVVQGRQDFLWGSSYSDELFPLYALP